MGRFCCKCGFPIKETEKFCIKCGAKVNTVLVSPIETVAEEAVPVEEKACVYPIEDVSADIHADVMVDPVTEAYEDTAEPAEKVTALEDDRQNKEKKSVSFNGIGTKLFKTKPGIITLASIGLVLTVGLIILISYLASPGYSVASMVKAGNLTSAYSEYQANVEGQTRQEKILTDRLNGYGDTVIKQFEQGTVSQKTAEETLTLLKTMGVQGADEDIKELSYLVALKTGDEYYQKGDLENAMKEYGKIPRENQNYATASDKLKELYPQYVSTIVSKAEQYCKQKNYKSAVIYLNSVYESLPDEVDKSEIDEVKEKAESGYKAEVMDDVSISLSLENYEEAIQTVNEAITIYDNPEFQTLLSKTEQDYVNHITAKVNAYLAAEDYESAGRVADTAANLLKDNADLQSLKTRVEKSTPTFLMDVCTPYSSENYEAYTKGESVVMAGASHSNGFSLDADSGNAIFNLNGQYTALGFTVGHIDDTELAGTIVKIYCDGILKKEVQLEGEGLPQRISVDITGVKQLKFECIANPYLSRAKYGFANITVK